MSVQIELPCGCRINEAFVLALCMEHALELDAKKLESMHAYKEFEDKMRGVNNG